MMKFNPNAIVVNTITGQRYFINKYSASINSTSGFTEKYELMEYSGAGTRIEVVGTAINDYVDEATLPPGWFPPGRHIGYPTLPPDLVDALRYVTFDDTHIKLHKNLISKKECDHEWVTWTGLRGEVTDCTKCKAVK
jgi:hypothetical protein